MPTVVESFPFHPKIQAYLDRIAKEQEGKELMPKMSSTERCPNTMYEALNNSDAPYWDKAMTTEVSRLCIRDLFYKCKQFIGFICKG
jgi:hypothetical protein